VPLVVPCHRVVASDGSLGGFSASEGIPMKQRMLDLEGLDVRNRESAKPKRRRAAKR
jgi:alkylated DNA nucleotide flippase Atl1